MLRPENIEITRYSYSMFPHFPTLPSTFTHGATDPELENRLLARDTFARIATNAGTALDAGRLEKVGDLGWDSSSDQTHASLDRTLRIEPGRFYLLKFDFERPATTSGVLQIRGDHFFREYGLPEHGGTRAFGAGGEHADTLPVSTTAGAEDLAIRYFPAEPVQPGKLMPHVAQVKLLSYDRDSLPVRVDSWIPYRARVRSAAAAWLESPRAFQTGYRAWVDGKAAAVAESPDALVCVAVPKGDSSVELRYAAPPGLALLFWLSLAAIIGSVSFAAAQWILHLLGGPSPAKACEAAPGAKAT